MRRLTAVGLSDWLHVLRPSPARLERAFEDARAIEVDEIRVALVDERTFLVGCVHLLDVESGHFRPPDSVVGSVAIHSQRDRNVNRDTHEGGASTHLSSRSNSPREARS